MSEKKQPGEKVGRRDFLKFSSMVVIGASCLGVGLREVVAAAKASGKDVLTEQNLNRLFEEAASRKAIKSVAVEVKRDLPAFLKNNFSLTAVQERAIQRFWQQSRSEIVRLMTALEQKGGTLKVQFKNVQERPAAAAVMSFTSASSMRARCKVKATAKMSDETYSEVEAEYES